MLKRQGLDRAYLAAMWPLFSGLLRAHHFGRHGYHVGRSLLSMFVDLSQQHHNYNDGQW